MKTRITLTQEDMMLLSYILENMHHSDLMAYCKKENNSNINYLMQIYNIRYFSCKKFVNLIQLEYIFEIVELNYYTIVTH